MKLSEEQLSDRNYLKDILKNLELDLKNLNAKPLNVDELENE